MAEDTTINGTRPSQQSGETLSDGAMELQRAREEQERKKGLSTGAKVGIGVGVAVGTGLAGFGIYKLGDHYGWWRRPGGIIIDDSVPPPEDGKTPSNSGGGTSTRKRATGRPPNISGDSAGYNTTLWPRPGPIRLAMITQGYKVEANEKPLAPDDTPNAQVSQLQIDWNKVIRGLDSGKVKLPKGVSQPQLFKHFRGLLTVDGIPGKNTLNALEVILTNYTKNALYWKKLKEQTK